MNVRELLNADSIKDICTALDILEIEYSISNEYYIKIIYEKDNVNKYRNLKKLYPELDFIKSTFDEDEKNYIVVLTKVDFYY